MPAAAEPRGVRVSEVVAALSNAGDLAMGQPVEHGLKAAVFAVHLARACGAGREVTDAAYYTTLLRWSGCTANAQGFARLLGDDIRGRAALQSSEPAGRRRLLAADPATHAAVRQLSVEHCEVAQMLSVRLGMAPGVTVALGQVFEQYDGGGLPDGLAGHALALPVQLAVLAGDVEILLHQAGIEGARERLLARAGTLYDPGLVRLAVAELPAWADQDVGHGSDVWAWAMANEPIPRAPLPGPELDVLLTALADFVDIKIPYLVGHSRAVAEIARRAAEPAGLPTGEASSLWRAGLVHDIGRVAVPNPVWNRPGRLTAMERTLVQLHPYYTDRCLAPIRALRPVAALASLHHERCDGSGYHRQLQGASLSTAARVLAAADVWVGLTGDRAHRPALAREAATAILRREAATGALDPAAVRAVLDAVGVPRRNARVSWPAGLTDREVEVLRLTSRGLTNRQIAARLVLAPKTVGNHLQHIYDKLGVRSRAGATLAAVQHGLVAAEDEAFTSGHRS